MLKREKRLLLNSIPDREYSTRILMINPAGREKVGNSGTGIPFFIQETIRTTSW